MFMVFDLIRICTERFYFLTRFLNLLRISLLMQNLTLQLFAIFFKNNLLNLNYKERVILFIYYYIESVNYIYSVSYIY